MKRLLISAGLALLVHSLLLSLNADWVKGKRPQKESPEPISLSLNYLIPEKTEEVIQPPPVEKNTPAIKKETVKEVPPETVIKKKIRKTITKKKVRPEVIQEAPAITETMDKTEEEISPEERPVPDYSSPTQGETHETEKPEITNIKPKVIQPERIPLREAIPVYKDNPDPKYPIKARRRGLEGSVILNVFVGTKGMVKEVRISESSGHSILDRAAIEAVEKWIFTPGMKGDEAVDMWVKVPIRFRLE